MPKKRKKSKHDDISTDSDDILGMMGWQSSGQMRPLIEEVDLVDLDIKVKTYNDLFEGESVQEGGGVVTQTAQKKNKKITKKRMPKMAKVTEENGSVCEEGERDQVSNCTGGLDEEGEVSKASTGNHTKKREGEKTMLAVKRSKMVVGGPYESILLEKPAPQPNQIVNEQIEILKTVPVLKDDKCILKNWHDREVALEYRIHEPLYSYVVNKGFVTPTNIQESIFGPAVTERMDIVATAPTGSGKTVGYLMPLLSNMLSDYMNILESKQRGKINQIRQSLDALVILPSRELAKQVYTVCRDLLEGCPLDVKSALIVGGVSHDKQCRVLLKEKPNILIGTPGRLWAIINTTTDQDTIQYYQCLTTLKFLVLDEADSLLEAPKGEFEQLMLLLKKILKASRRGKIVQKFLISATMSIPSHLKRQFAKRRDAGIHRGKAKKEVSIIERLTKGVALRPKMTHIVDLSGPVRQVAMSGDNKTNMEQIGSSRAQVSLPSTLSIYKDLINVKYLIKQIYIHLLHHFEGCEGPSKAMIFVNAKSSVYRTSRVLRYLFGSDPDDLQNPYIRELVATVSPKASVEACHSNLRQERRFKKIENFTNSTGKTIIVATDVLARGIDIEGVDLVIHAQVPRNASIFVHRSGRTARAGANGKVICLTHPEVHKKWAAIFKSLNMNFETVPEFEYMHNLPKRKYLQITDRYLLAYEISQAVDKTRNSKKKESEIHCLAKMYNLDADEVVDATDSEDDDCKEMPKEVLLQNKATLYEMLQGLS